MVRNAIQSYFWTSKMATGGHLKKNITKKVARVIWTMFESTAGRLQLDINSLLVNIYTYRQLCWERGPLGRMYTILVNEWHLMLGFICNCWPREILQSFKINLAGQWVDLVLSGCWLFYTSVNYFLHRCFATEGLLGSFMDTSDGEWWYFLIAPLAIKSFADIFAIKHRIVIEHFTSVLVCTGNGYHLTITMFLFSPIITWWFYHMATT